MWPRVFSVFSLLLLYSIAFAQEKFTVAQDVRSQWMIVEEGAYKTLGELPFRNVNTIYFELDRSGSAGRKLLLESERPYFFFVNGKVMGEFEGRVMLDVDSLSALIHAPAFRIAIHQEKINDRDLRTTLISPGALEAGDPDFAAKPYSPLRDFSVIGGFIIILFFLLLLQLHPKLAADYFTLSRLVASRDADDGQAGSRLTSGSNVQFYILCSLMVGFYLLIILHNLPAEYALPVRFHASGFWMMLAQWLKISMCVFVALLIKLLIVFSLTRLFGFRGMARFHFFNWVRLMLVIFGAATIVLFTYFISRGDSADTFVMFLSVVIVALIVWIVVAYFKLSGRSGHSMFHLFSYLCATEIIPLLITVKVLFQ